MTPPRPTDRAEWTAEKSRSFERRALTYSTICTYNSLHERRAPSGFRYDGCVGAAVAKVGRSPLDKAPGRPVRRRATTYATDRQGQRGRPEVRRPPARLSRHRYPDPARHVPWQAVLAFVVSGAQ